MTASTLKPAAEAPGVRRSSRGQAVRNSSTAWRVAVIGGALLLWELLARLGVINDLFVSKPSSIIRGAVTLYQSPLAAKAIGETLTSLTGAFVIGTGLGVLAGIVLGLRPLLRSAYLPIVMMLMGTPKSAFLPAFIVFFGLGGTSAVAFGSLMAFVHVTVNVVAGVDLVEPKHLLVARAYRASAWRRFRHVILLGASPGLFTALWHGLRNAFIGVVIAELFASRSGIGTLVKTYSNNFQTAEALALVLTVSLVVILVGTAWNRLEAHLTRWQGKEGAR
jgi:ABC-type nitrate/sulfonate/bicarbonate transport system permease component